MTKKQKKAQRTTPIRHAKPTTTKAPPKPPKPPKPAPKPPAATPAPKPGLNLEPHTKRAEREGTAPARPTGDFVTRGLEAMATRESQTRKLATKPTGAFQAKAVELVAQFLMEHIDGELLLHAPLTFEREGLMHQSGMVFVKYVLRRNGITTPFGHIYLPERQAQGIRSMVALGVR